jgi:hypothetical protein
MRETRQFTVAKQETSNGQNTCLNIVGGKETDGFPEVYRISYRLSGNSWYTCTGTFVSDNTLVTAAHCMPMSGTPEDLYLDSNKIVPSEDGSPIASALKIFFSPQCGPSPLNEGKRACDRVGDDVAIAVFPDRTASHWLPLATSEMPIKTQVTIVGYGQTSLDINTSGVVLGNDVSRKKFGFNRLTTAPAEISALRSDQGASRVKDTYTIVGWRRDGEAASRGQDTAVPAKGDSGGPLIAKDLLIGVSSTYFVLDETKESEDFNIIEGYASLTGPTAKSLIREAVASGARITTRKTTGEEPQKTGSSQQDGEKSPGRPTPVCL